MAELDYDYIAQLVVQAQKGSSDAFAELYAATYRRQYQFACRYVKDIFLAQDILQETYILVLKNLSKLKNPRLFVSWINQITFHVCFDYNEKFKVQRRVRTKFWTTIGLRKEPFYVFKRTKGYCTTDISSNRVCN